MSLSTSTNIDSAISVVPYSDDPIRYCAEHIIQAYRADLPVLDKVVIIIEDPALSNQLRQTLNLYSNAQQFSALLGPRICTLKEWVLENASQKHASNKILHHGKELLLLNVVRQHPELCEHSDPWRLCTTLLELFNNLYLNQIDLEHDWLDFNKKVSAAYQLADELSSHCQNETRIVHTLWHAWQSFLKQTQSIDANQYYCQQLQQLQQSACQNQYLYFLGASDYSLAEYQLIKRLLNWQQAHLIVQLNLSKDTNWPNDHSQKLAHTLNVCWSDIKTNDKQTPATTAFFDAVFAYGSSQLMQRAEQFKNTYPLSPISDQISIFAANGNEQQAQAIEIQIRLWHKQGIDSIAVIVENRKLARRIRALLERTNISVQDSAGWTLSSTSAATIIERWLECLESDFSYLPFLDLLKSPFIAIMPERNTFETLVHRLERDIIVHDNISVNISNYQHALNKRSKQLGWTSKTTTALTTLLKQLQTLQQAYATLLNGQSHSLEKFLEQLMLSLESLGILDSFNNDQAGREIIQLLAQLKTSAIQLKCDLNWQDFRTWLAQTLENAHFKPHAKHKQIMLLTLSQTRLARFKRVIIAANEMTVYPGPASFSPYFNNHVHEQLGLPAWRDKVSKQFYHYRRILEAVDYRPDTSSTNANPADAKQNDHLVLLTYSAENEGEEIPISPWLDALQTFHQLAYGDKLNNKFLDYASRKYRSDNRADPELDYLKTTFGSSVSLSADAFPEKISVSNHQQLINCPYQFFCASSLALRAADEVRETLSKQDFGQRVHLCLQAFHTDLPGYPGPFKQPISNSNQEQASQLLEEIGQAVFAKDIDNNYQHRAWLTLWQKRIPEYIAWQIKHQDKYQIVSTEQSISRELKPGLTIKGIIDRVEQDANERRYLIDYKTGMPPSKQDVLHGESIQLLSYALLFNNVVGIEYLQIGTQGVKSTVVIEAPLLTELKDQTRKRLIDIYDLIKAGKELHAWGDNKTCQLCEMSGICRQQSWQDKN